MNENYKWQKWNKRKEKGSVDQIKNNSPKESKNAGIRKFEKKKETKSYDQKKETEVKIYEFMLDFIELSDHNVAINMSVVKYLCEWSK